MYHISSLYPILWCMTFYVDFIWCTIRSSMYHCIRQNDPTEVHLWILTAQICCTKGLFQEGHHLVAAAFLCHVERLEALRREPIWKPLEGWIPAGYNQMVTKFSSGISLTVWDVLSMYKYRYIQIYVYIYIYMYIYVVPHLPGEGC